MAIANSEEKANPEYEAIRKAHTDAENLIAGLKTKIHSEATAEAVERDILDAKVTIFETWIASISADLGLPNVKKVHLDLRLRFLE